jgi:hypothetical protein
MKEITVVTTDGAAHFHGDILVDPEEGTVIVTNIEGVQDTQVTFNFDHVVSVVESPYVEHEGDPRGYL